MSLVCLVVHLLFCIYLWLQRTPLFYFLILIILPSTLTGIYHHEFLQVISLGHFLALSDRNINIM